MSRNALLGALALAFCGSIARADEAPSSRCIDVSVPKGSIAAAGGQWIALTREQWEFLRGIYTMNPETPAGLPFGDSAVLAQIPGNKGGLVFFIDGSRACTPMEIPVEIVDLMRDVATDEIAHELASP